MWGERSMYVVDIGEPRTENRDSRQADKTGNSSCRCSQGIAAALQKPQQLL